MSSDKLRHKKITQTGSMPRSEIEPELNREAPPPSLPELRDEDQSATTGEMPIVSDRMEEDKTRDEDSPTGR